MTLAGNSEGANDVARTRPGDRPASRRSVSMAPVEMETRLAVLEREVAELKSRIEKSPASDAPWWERIAGTFAGDPAHDEAMKLGREYRESRRPRKSGGLNS